jgi:hypothetical protein
MIDRGSLKYLTKVEYFMKAADWWRVLTDEGKWLTKTIDRKRPITDKDHWLMKAETTDWRRSITDEIYRPLKATQVFVKFRRFTPRRSFYTLEPLAWVTEGPLFAEKAIVECCGSITSHFRLKGSWEMLTYVDLIPVRGYLVKWYVPTKQHFDVYMKC